MTRPWRGDRWKRSDLSRVEYQECSLRQKMRELGNQIEPRDKFKRVPHNSDRLKFSNDAWEDLSPKARMPAHRQPSPTANAVVPRPSPETTRRNPAANTASITPESCAFAEVFPASKKKGKAGRQLLGAWIERFCNDDIIQ
jgi:hypothetical protein